jgi:hypothetical protein
MIAKRPKRKYIGTTPVAVAPHDATGPVHRIRDLRFILEVAASINSAGWVSHPRGTECRFVQA